VTGEDKDEVNFIAGQKKEQLRLLKGTGVDYGSEKKRGPAECQ